MLDLGNLLINKNMISFILNNITAMGSAQVLENGISALQEIVIQKQGRKQGTQVDQRETERGPR